MFVIFYASGSNLETIGSGSGPVVIGITFMLITMRVGLGWGQDFKRTTFDSGTARSLGRHNIRTQGGEQSIPMRAFNLNVTSSPVEAAVLERRERDSEDASGGFEKGKRGTVDAAVV